MAGETVITVVGNLTADPELRYTPAGMAVAKFTVASTPRVFDKQSREWKDGEGLFLSCSVWRQAAEHVAESLAKGMRVIVQGRLRQRSFEDRAGVKRTVVELEVEEVGPSLLRATAVVSRVAGKVPPVVEEARRAQGRASVEDPWQQSAGGGGWGSGEEPPAVLMGVGW
ncbi:single-stranded DNA-binding protein [Streptomyces hebeiensis]